MNKKSVLVQGFAMYITMVGVCYAGPPPFVVETDPNSPLAVETVEGNPLEVTVVDAAVPAVKIPAQGAEFCSISKGSSSCRIRIIDADSYPEGTNTFVFQTIAVDHRIHRDADNRGAKYHVLTHFQGQSYSFEQVSTGDGSQFHPESSIEKSQFDRVLMYHDGQPLASPVSVTFQNAFATPDDSPGTLRQLISWSGYYTWIAPR